MITKIWLWVTVWMLWVTPALAEVDEVVIGIDGLSCPFCVVGVEDRLGEIDALTDLEISLKQGLARVKVKEGALLDLDLVKTKVEASGFTLRDITLTVVGVLESWQDGLALRVRGTDELFLLDTDRHTEYVGHVDTQTLVTVTGKAHQHADLPPALSVEELKVVE